jgi:hypothetical protein
MLIYTSLTKNQPHYSRPEALLPQASCFFSSYLPAWKTYRCFPIKLLYLAFVTSCLLSIPFFPHFHAAVMGRRNKMTANKNNRNLKISQRSYLGGDLISCYTLFTINARSFSRWLALMHHHQNGRKKKAALATNPHMEYKSLINISIFTN